MTTSPLSNKPPFITEHMASKIVTLGASVSMLFPSTVHADVLIQMGANDGALSFLPSQVQVHRGEKVVFRNNTGYPHRVLFDEDDVPEGVDADALGHDTSYAPGEEVSNTFDIVGHYGYYCEPHKGIGMVGSIDVVDDVVTNDSGL